MTQLADRRAEMIGGSGSLKETHAAGGFPTRVLMELHPAKTRSMSIGNLARSLYYVRESAFITDLVDDLSDRESVFALGVVDDEMHTVGIVVRRELFDIMGRQYGRDLYRNKRVERVMQPAAVFDAERNILSVEEELAGILYGTNNRYFTLSDHLGRFTGVFSTRDMLIFLSQLTKRDIDLARRLQSSIVPGEYAFQGEKVGVAAGSVMAKGVGGDYYFLKRYDQENWAIMLCDVSGKGIAASLVSAIVGGMASVYDFTAGMRQFIIRLNAYIATTFESEKFITGVFANLCERNGELTIFDMGHSHVYLFREGKMSRITTKDDNVPLGVRPVTNARPAKITLSEGDMIVIVTDGILEQNNQALEDFGILRLARIVAAYRDKGLVRMKDEIVSAVHIFRKSQPQLDDITILLMEYRGRAGTA